MTRTIRGDSTAVREARMPGSSVRRKRKPWRTAMPRSSMSALVSGLDCTKQILSKVNFAALRVPHGVRPPQNLDQLHLHIGVSASVLVQEISEHAFYDLWRRRDLQHAGVSAPEQLCPLTQGARVSLTERGNRSGEHFSQRATCPPRAAVRQLSIADITLNWPRLTWPALALRHAAPWPRKTSATSKLGRDTRAAL
jgi:hypothetical protein